MATKLLDLPAKFTVESCGQLQKTDAFVVSLYLFDVGDRFSCLDHVDDDTIRGMAIIGAQNGANVVLAVSRCWDLARRYVNFVRSSKDGGLHDPQRTDRRPSRASSAADAAECLQHEGGAKAVLVIDAPIPCATLPI